MLPPCTCACCDPICAYPSGVLLEELLPQGGRTRSYPEWGADVQRHRGVGSPPTGSAEAGGGQSAAPSTRRNGRQRRILLGCHQLRRYLRRNEYGGRGAGVGSQDPPGSPTMFALNILSPRRFGMGGAVRSDRVAVSQHPGLWCYDRYSGSSETATSLPSLVKAAQKQQPTCL